MSCRHSVLPLPRVVVLACGSPPLAPDATREEQLKNFPKVVLVQVDLTTASSGRAISAYVSLRWYCCWKTAALLKMHTVLSQIIWALPSSILLERGSHFAIFLSASKEKKRGVRESSSILQQQTYRTDFTGIKATNLPILQFIFQCQIRATSATTPCNSAASS